MPSTIPNSTYKDDTGRPVIVDRRERSILLFGSAQQFALRPLTFAEVNAHFRRENPVFHADFAISIGRLARFSSDQANRPSHPLTD
jgi:hypothetical protein